MAVLKRGGNGGGYRDGNRNRSRDGRGGDGRNRDRNRDGRNRDGNRDRNRDGGNRGRRGEGQGRPGSSNGRGERKHHSRKPQAIVKRECPFPAFSFYFCNCTYYIITCVEMRCYMLVRLGYVAMSVHLKNASPSQTMTYAQFQK